jgi:3-hydroxyisobutyrate dehydrogenase-like beta-hydroxyacid dehydrogenase
MEPSAFIGLGAMGTPMALNLAEAHLQVAGKVRRPPPAPPRSQRARARAAAARQPAACPSFPSSGAGEDPSRPALARLAPTCLPAPRRCAQPLAVYNRTRAKASALAAAAPPGAAAAAASAAAALGGARVVHTLLSDDAACDAVIGELLAAAPAQLAGAVVVNHSTAHPDCARRAAAALGAAGAHYVAAPVFGRWGGAGRGGGLGVSACRATVLQAGSSLAGRQLLEAGAVQGGRVGGPPGKPRLLEGPGRQGRPRISARPYLPHARRAQARRRGRAQAACGACRAAGSAGAGGAQPGGTGARAAVRGV